MEGLAASIGSVGDAYDNAAAETVMGLYKNEAVAKNSAFTTGPLKTIADVEEITFDWVTGTTPAGSTAPSGTFRPRNTNATTTMKQTAR